MFKSTDAFRESSWPNWSMIPGVSSPRPMWVLDVGVAERRQCFVRMIPHSSQGPELCYRRTSLLNPANARICDFSAMLPRTSPDP